MVEWRQTTGWTYLGALAAFLMQPDRPSGAAGPEVLGLDL
jgi:hypothetical protein